MGMKITHIFITVDDHEAGLDYFVNVLGFRKTWDLAMPDGWRWLTVSPADMDDCNVVINKAGTDQEKALVGRQSAPPYTPVMIIETDDFTGQYETWKARGVAFEGQPESMPWGTYVNFRDPWGNLHLLLQSNPDFTEGMVREG